eukprot:UN12170
MGLKESEKEEVSKYVTEHLKQGQLDEPNTEEMMKKWTFKNNDVEDYIQYHLHQATINDDAEMITKFKEEVSAAADGRVDTSGGSSGDTTSDR